MTKTDAIRAYDVAHLSGSDLEGIAYYLAGANDAERARYLATNQRIAQMLRALLDG